MTKKKKKQRWLLQVRNLEEQVKLLRKENETLKNKVEQLEEAVKNVLENIGMVEY